MNGLAVLVAVEALGLVAAGVGAGRDDQLVVGQLGAVGEHDLGGLGLDDLDLAHEQLDAVGDQPGLGLHDLVGLVDAERDEQVARLVVVVGL